MNPAGKIHKAMNANKSSINALLALEIDRAMQNAERDGRKRLWPHYSSTMAFKYQPSKGSFDEDTIIQTAKEFLFCGDYAYYAERQQAINNYYIRCICLKTGAVDLITYTDNLKSAKAMLKLIKEYEPNTNPASVKYTFYNGSGLPELSNIKVKETA